MTEITSELIKNLMTDYGMTVVGIASVDRFEGAPPGHGPLELLPTAKSVVVAGVIWVAKS